MNKTAFILILSFFVTAFLQPFSQAQITEQDKAQHFADEVLHRKKLQKQNNQALAEQYLKEGLVFYEREEYSKAVTELKKAKILAPDNKKINNYLSKAEKKLAKKEAKHYSTGVRLYKKGDFKGAIAELDKIPESNFKYKAAQKYKEKIITALDKESQEDKTVLTTEELKEEAIADHYKKGQDFVKDKKYLKAITEFENILKIDSNHRPAQKALRKSFSSYIEKEVQSAEEKEKIERELRFIDVDKASIPSVEEKSAEETSEDFEKVVKITEKTEGILLIEKRIAEKKVSMDFRDTDIREVIRYLVETSGVNIVLDETVFTSTEEGGGVAQPEPKEFEFGQETDNEDGEETAGADDWGDAFSPKKKKDISPKITLFVKDIPLIKALDIILRAKGLKHKIEEDFIWVSTPANLMREDLETRIYNLKHLTGRFANFPAIPFREGEMGSTDEGGGSKSVPIGVGQLYRSESPSFEATPAAAPVEAAAAGGITFEEPSDTKLTTNIRDVLIQVVPQVPGSTIILYERLGKLIVRNTPTNMKILERILTALDVASLQVALEIRILEVSSFKGQDIGIDWTEVKHDYKVGQREALMNILHDAGNFGTQNLTGGLELSFTRLDSTDVKVILRALEKNKNVSVLSAPKLTCLNNQTANIRVITTHNYISRWDRETQGSEHYISWFRESWEPVIGQIGEGLILEITPNVSADKKTIALTVHPAIVELMSMETAGEADHPLTLPTTVGRSVDTTVSIKNADTLVFGGLMKNNEVTDTRKVPILGSIPVLGRFFRADTKYKSKSNLLIFITGRILNAEGKFE